MDSWTVLISSLKIRMHLWLSTARKTNTFITIQSKTKGFFSSYFSRLVFDNIR